jgi:hypothetical protein
LRGIVDCAQIGTETSGGTVRRLTERKKNEKHLPAINGE